MDNMITLVKDTINNTDIDELIEWLKTYPRLTKGNLTVELEEKWAAWLGTKYSVFVNSGSSALLLMIYALIENGTLSPRDKVVVPALSWATDLAPIIQFGLTPTLCDCNLEDLSVDLSHLEEIFIKENPKALILVSVLGFCPNMKQVQELCQKYEVVLLEDACESTGSSVDDRKLGTFGAMSTFSCYFGHHFSTIEGGFINTDDYELYSLLKMLRSHGWDRDLDENYKRKIGSAGNSFHSAYRFYVPGFNLRSTDLQAKIGLGQIDKLDSIVSRRNENYLFYKENIKNEYWMPSDVHGFVSNFAFPLIHPDRDRVIELFQERNIEIRPLICGSMGAQPMYVSRYGRLDLKNATIVDQYGCYIPNHPDLTNDERQTIVNTVNEGISSHVQ